MSAKVDPAKLRSAINAKLDSARLELHKLRESDKPERNRFTDPDQYVVAFLHAARGVYPTIETFAEAQVGKAAFKSWIAAWQGARSPNELKLWQQMRSERIDQEHGEGARLIAQMIEVPNERTDTAFFAITRQIPHQNKTSKGGVRFEAYPHTPISVVCESYLVLCHRFVDDFLRVYAGMIP